MRRIYQWYSGISWRDRILFSFAMLAIAVAVGISVGGDLMLIVPVVLGIIVLGHMFCDKNIPLGNILVIAVHLILAAPVFIAYTALAAPMLGNTAGVYAVLIVALTSVLIPFLSYKFSIGKLWITMGLAYLMLDIVAPIVMVSFGLMNTLIGVGMAFVAIVVRSILWRDFFRNRKANIPAEIKNRESAESVKSIFSQLDGVEVRDLDSDVMDFEIITATKSYYVNAITLRQRIVVVDGNVASGRFNLKSALYETAKETDSFNKSKKRKERLESIPCLLNVTDKTKSSLKVSVSLSGNKRDKGKDVIILSPSSLVGKIKRENAALISVEA